MSEPQSMTVDYVKEQIGPRCQEVFEGFIILGVTRQPDGSLSREMFFDSTSANAADVTKSLEPAIRVGRAWGRSHL